jgi:hypothetical protein
MKFRSVATIAVLGFGVIASAMGCGGELPGPSRPVINGWPIGDRAECSSGGCEDSIEVATEALDSGHPGHPEVVDASLYSTAGPLTTSVAYSVVVFRFVDGTYRAIGVGVGVGPSDSGGSAYRLFARDLDP